VHLISPAVTAAIPSLESYLTTLPNGLDSFPEAQIRGSAMRSALERCARVGVKLALLPPPLGQMKDEPPAVHHWIPEVQHSTLMLAAYEQVFASAGGISGFETWVFEDNKRLLSSGLYRVLFAVVSPERVLLGAPKRWTAFRRGSSIRVLESKRAEALVEMVHPKGLMNLVGIIAVGAAWRAAARVAGATATKVAVVEWDGARAVYQLRYV
jgi:hypothetical protein